MTTKPQATDSPQLTKQSVSFPATIPPTEIAIRIHGEGGARLILDIAESDLGAFLPALIMRGKRLKVTMEDIDGVR